MRSRPLADLPGTVHTCCACSRLEQLLDNWLPHKSTTLVLTAHRVRPRQLEPWPHEAQHGRLQPSKSDSQSAGSTTQAARLTSSAATVRKSSLVLPANMGPMMTWMLPHWTWLPVLS